MDDAALMTKYGLSAKGLQSLFNKLVLSGLISRSDLDRRVNLAPGSVVLDLADLGPTSGPPLPTAAKSLEIEPPIESAPASGKPAISAKAALADIRNGMDDASLMEKYKLSSRGLESLLQKMKVSGVITQKELNKRKSLAQGSVVLDVPAELPPPPRKLPPPTPQPAPPAPAAGMKKARISAAEVAFEIAGGMDDTRLMKRYGLSAKGLQSLLRKLVASGLVSQEEVERRQSLATGSVVIDMDDFAAAQPDRRPVSSSKPRPRGEIKWEYQTGNWFSSRPATDGDLIYFGSGDGSLRAVDLQTGAEKWRRELEGGVVTHHVVLDGSVYAVTEYGWLHALDAPTGKSKWQFRPEIGVHDAPMASGRIIYIGSLDGTVYALDKRSGLQVWSFSVQGTAVSSPATTSGVVCFGSDNGSLYCVVPK
jgi:predicted transcriptional regulator